MKGWIDTHSHLDFPDFEKDLPAILERAKEAGLEKIITIGTGLHSSRAAVRLAEAHPQIYAAIGIHPGNVEEEPEEVLAFLEPLLHHPKVAAIGECGTDYHYLPAKLETEDLQEYQARLSSLKERQSFFFRKQLDLAARHQLNVVIHQRDSWEDTVRILKEYTGRLKAVFHCFGGTPAQASEILAMGHLVSFTGIMTFKNAGQVRTSAASLPPGSYMIETDCPYLAPVPYRGKRCEPSHVREVGLALARERCLSEDQLRDELYATTHAFFRLTA